MNNYETAYIHGYSPTEQHRLLEQAHYWRDKLILRNADYKKGGRLLDLGCGVGAILGVLGPEFPQLQLSGIDIQPQQIAYATQYLRRIGLSHVDLRTGDAASLPWPDDTFDYINATWVLEHVADPNAVLREAYRVLKPDGTIRLTEGETRALLVVPDSSDYRYLRASILDLLHRAGGTPWAAQSLGTFLDAAGFRDIQVIPTAFHHYRNPRDTDLREFIDHMYAWIAPMLPQLTEKLGRDIDRLRSGLSHFCSIPEQPGSSASVLVYQGLAVKPR